MFCWLNVLVMLRHGFASFNFNYCLYWVVIITSMNNNALSVPNLIEISCREIKVFIHCVPLA